MKRHTIGFYSWVASIIVLFALALALMILGS